MSDEPRVVRLDGKPVDAPHRVDTKLVECLESLLTDARTGRISSLAMSSKMYDSGVSTYYHVAEGDSVYDLLGAMRRLEHNVMRDQDRKNGRD